MPSDLHVEGNGGRECHFTGVCWECKSKSYSRKRCREEKKHTDCDWKSDNQGCKDQHERGAEGTSESSSKSPLQSLSTPGGGAAGRTADRDGGESSRDNMPHVKGNGGGAKKGCDCSRCTASEFTLMCWECAREGGKYKHKNNMFHRCRTESGHMDIDWRQDDREGRHGGGDVAQMATSPGTASLGGKMTARDAPGGKTPRAQGPRSPAVTGERRDKGNKRSRSPAAEGGSRAKGDKTKKPTDRFCHSEVLEQGAASSTSNAVPQSPIGRNLSGGSGSRGSGRRGMSQDNPKPEASGRQLVVSVDFGHDGTGYATVCKSHEGDLHAKVRALGEPVNNTKAPTCLLLDKDYKYVAFGDCARKKATQESREDEIKFNSNFMYSEGFKMELKKMSEDNEEPNVQPTMGLTNGVPFSTLVQVIFEQIALEAYKAETTHSREPISTVTCVTPVPVTWSPAARKLMQNAAEKGFDAILIAAEQAGLQVPVINPILLPSEPEAAVLFATRNDPVAIGERIMIIDNGAGTLDISTHEIGTR
mmetsp:Transcript_80410/g.130283  ORF Transcript_80410/g.130283 Transcript_80410/m.130283 type:complete len:533 (+) Transcript_80410:275-1873(+)